MEALEVYERVLAVTNYFLENASHLTFEAIKEFDPSVEEMTTNLKLMSGVLRELSCGSFEDENMAINAYQCCLLMGEIAMAVTGGEKDEFNLLIGKLEKHVAAP